MLKQKFSFDIIIVIFRANCNKFVKIKPIPFPILKYPYFLSRFSPLRRTGDEIPPLPLGGGLGWGLVLATRIPQNGKWYQDSIPAN